MLKCEFVEPFPADIKQDGPHDGILGNPICDFCQLWWKVSFLKKESKQLSTIPESPTQISCHSSYIAYYAQGASWAMLRRFNVAIFSF